jgi:hypothetical protein
MMYRYDSFADTRQTADDLFGHGWFKAFCTLNKYGINTLIALIEIVVLSSIKRQEVS